jgi:hypothetical protein
MQGGKSIVSVKLAHKRWFLHTAVTLGQLAKRFYSEFEDAFFQRHAGLYHLFWRRKLSTMDGIIIQHHRHHCQAELPERLASDLTQLALSL